MEAFKIEEFTYSIININNSAYSKRIDLFKKIFASLVNINTVLNKTPTNMTEFYLGFFKYLPFNKDMDNHKFNLSHSFKYITKISEEIFKINDGNNKLNATCINGRPLYCPHHYYYNYNLFEYLYKINGNSKISYKVYKMDISSMDEVLYFYADKIDSNKKLSKKEKVQNYLYIFNFLFNVRMNILFNTSKDFPIFNNMKKRFLDKYPEFLDRFPNIDKDDKILFLLKELNGLSNVGGFYQITVGYDNYIPSDNIISLHLNFINVFDILFNYRLSYYYYEKPDAIKLIETFKDINLLDNIDFLSSLNIISYKFVDSWYHIRMIYKSIYKNNTKIEHDTYIKILKANSNTKASRNKILKFLKETSYDGRDEVFYEYFMSNEESLNIRNQMLVNSLNDGGEL